MNAITKDQQTALSLPERAAVALGAMEYEIKLRELLTNSAGILTVTNKAGRDECHSAYMVLKNARCGITNLSGAATEDAKAFTKAVKAEAVRLIAITTAEEDRLQALRDQFDSAEQARKDALIAAERRRIESIQSRIAVVRNLPASTVGKSGAEISQMIYELAATITPNSEHEATFEEFEKDFRAIRTEVLDLLAKAETKQLGIEADARAAEQARIAEAARLEAERAELAALRAAATERQRVAKIESDRIAAEQAAEAKRLSELAAAQELAAKQLAEKTAANLKVEQDALAERVRIENERAAAEQAERDRVAAEAQARIDAQQAQIDADRKALADERAAQVAAHEAAIKLEADHAEALADDAQFDIDLAERRERKYFERHAQDDAAADLARCTETAQAMLTNGRSIVQPVANPAALSLAAYSDAGLDESLAPADDEIAALADEFGMSAIEWVERLDLFVMTKRAEIRAAA